MEIQNITKESVGQTIDIKGKIENIIQTTGPTLFVVFDGTGTITAKCFAGAGQRALEDIQQGDVVSFKVEIREHRNELEAEVKEHKKLPVDDFNKLIQERIEKLAKPFEPDFTIQSEILEKLRPKILKVAFEIKKAIVEGRPILMRHHADCDGYCGGISLERAILPLIQGNNTEKDAWKLYKRSPSKAPYYEYSDVTKDLSYALEDMSKFGLKEPLVLLVDNGSTHEDLLSIKKMRIYGAKIVVVDHHYPGAVKDEKSEIDEYVCAHVNPYLVGGDSNLCAGMLGVEIARFINDKTQNIDFLGGLAGVADRTKGKEFEQYLEIAQKEGYSKELLHDIAESIDFEAYYLRFLEARGLVNDLLGKDKKKQQQLVELIMDDIKERKEKQLYSAKHYAKITQVNQIKFVEVEATKITNRGEFPAVGKTVGMLHDEILKENNKVVTVGYGEDFITIRISDDVKLNINEIVVNIQKEKPHSFVDGGGHEHAGTLKFLPAALNEIKEYFLEEIKKLD